MSENGYDVEQIPPSKEKGVRKGDYKVEGREMDCYAPNNPAKSVRGIWSEVKSKVETGQTKRVVINLSDWKGDIAALKKQFADWPIDGLEEVIITTPDRKVLHIFP
jgi:hypothetical protein